MWFLEHCIAGAFVQFLAEAFMPVARAVDETYVPGAALLLSEGRALEAATVIQVGLEAVHRVHVHTETLVRCREQLLAFERGLSEAQYPPLDRAALVASSRKCTRALHRLLAKVAPELAKNPTSAERPDEFGHAYTTLSNACIDSIVDSDTELFENIFPAYFQLCLDSRQRISDELFRHDLRTRAVFMCDPLLDLLDISGYATVRGQLGAPRLEEVVRAVWISALGSTNGTFAQLLLTAVSLRSGTPLISPRSIVRTSWKRVFADEMVAEGWMKSDFGYVDTVRQQPLNPAARHFLKQGTWANVGDCFIATALVPMQPFQGLEQPSVVQEVISSVRRESERKGK